MKTRLSSLNYGEKFKLLYNGMIYKRYGYTDTGRIKVKAVEHNVSPVICQDMTRISCAPNCVVEAI